MGVVGAEIGNKEQGLSCGSPSRLSSNSTVDTQAAL